MDPNPYQSPQAKPSGAQRSLLMRVWGLFAKLVFGVLVTAMIVGVLVLLLLMIFV